MRRVQCDPGSLNESFTESWGARIRGNGSSLTRSQFRIFGAPGKGGNNCDFPDPGSYQPVATREEAIRKSGLNLAAVAEYADFHSKVHGQAFVMAPTSQPAASAGTPSRVADIPASLVFYGFNAGAINVYAEIAGPKAIIVFGCAGSSTTQVQVNENFSDGWSARIRSNGSSLTRSQFRIFGAFAGAARVAGGNNCDYPDPGSYQPVASREEAIRKSGLNLAAVGEYADFHSKVHGQAFVMAPTAQPAASAGTPSRVAEVAAANLRDLLARFEEEGSKARRSFFTLSMGADSIYAEVVNDRAIIVRSCKGEVRSWINPSMSGSWDVVFSSSGTLSWRGTLERDRFRLFSPTSGNFANFPCTYSGPAQLVSTRSEALAIAKLDLAALPDYSLFLAQA